MTGTSGFIEVVGHLNPKVFQNDVVPRVWFGVSLFLHSLGPCRFDAIGDAPRRNEHRHVFGRKFELVGLDSPLPLPSVVNAVLLRQPEAYVEVLLLIWQLRVAWVRLVDDGAPTLSKHPLLSENNAIGPVLHRLVQCG